MSHSVSYRVSLAKGPLSAVVPVPGSKSVANRALICAALATGRSAISNVPSGDDSASMLRCLTLLGIDVRQAPNDASAVTIAGCAGDLDGQRPGMSKSGLPKSGSPKSGSAKLATVLDTQLAGTTSRFLTALVALGTIPVLIDGAAALRARPMGPLHDALRALGVDVRSSTVPGTLPVTIQGPIAVRQADISIRGDISSQYISALMMIGPYLEHGLSIRLTTPLVSRPYVAITQSVMAAFGHRDVAIDADEVRIGPGRYSGCEFVVEPDASSASYPLAAAAMCGGSVTVNGLTATSTQGDTAFCGVLEAMGCTVTQDDRSTTVSRDSVELRGIDIDMVDMSDLVPTLAVVATSATTTTTIRGVGFIRSKESDRLGDLCHELRTAGADAEELDDGLRIHPSRLHAAYLHTHHDHRLAMAFGLLGLVVDGIEIDNPTVVSKSWPEFWSVLEALS